MNKTHFRNLKSNRTLESNIGGYSEWDTVEAFDPTTETVLMVRSCGTDYNPIPFTFADVREFGMKLVA